MRLHVAWAIIEKPSGSCQPVILHEMCDTPEQAIAAIRNQVAMEFPDSKILVPNASQIEDAVIEVAYNNLHRQDNKP